jgi:hypothetical protein
VTSRAWVAITVVGAFAVSSCAQATHPKLTRVYTSLRTVNGVTTVTTVKCIHSVCRPYHDEPRETRSRYGIACPAATSDRNLDPAPLPESYAVNEISKPGFPGLTPSEATTVRRIRRYVQSPTLRIAWLPPHGYRKKAEFVVFDAVDGPCSKTLAYGVLNGWCNEMYQPSFDAYSTWAAPDCLKATPPPWMTAESFFGRR